VTEISCDLCMDLMPLVRDGIASDDSRRAVLAHIEHCADCRALFESDPPPALSDHKQAVERLKRRIRLFSAMLLMFGIFFGLSLTAGSDLFYNTIIMPIIGVLGYCIFRWYALAVVPLLLFGTHIATNLLGILLGAAHLDLWSLVVWTVLYCIFAAVGVLIAGLVHFALRKERT